MQISGNALITVMLKQKLLHCIIVPRFPLRACLHGGGKPYVGEVTLLGG